MKQNENTIKIVYIENIQGLKKKTYNEVIKFKV